MTLQTSQVFKICEVSHANLFLRDVQLFEMPLSYRRFTHPCPSQEGMPFAMLMGEFPSWEGAGVGSSLIKLYIALFFTFRIKSLVKVNIFLRQTARVQKSVKNR